MSVVISSKPHQNRSDEEDNSWAEEFEHSSAEDYYSEEDDYGDESPVKQ